MMSGTSGKCARSARSPKRLFSPRPEPIGAPQGISTRQPACQQPLRHHQILGGVGEDLEALRAQDARGLGKPEDIRLQRVVFADHFEFDPGGREYLARHVRGRHRFLDRVAAGGVRQHAHAELTNERPETLAGALAARLTPQRHGHDLGARGTHRGRRAPPATDSARCRAAGASASVACRRARASAPLHRRQHLEAIALARAWLCARACAATNSPFTAVATTRPP